MLQPVTRMPASHPTVDRGVCGGLNAGDVIPNTFKWAENGKTDPDHNKCETVDAGSLFYAYFYPYSHSSNTGFEREDTALFYFVEDDIGQVYFVLVLDKPRGGGGYARMVVDAPELAGKGVEVRGQAGGGMWRVYRAPSCLPCTRSWAHTCRRACAVEAA